jgi:predicted transcriptional regulator
MKKDTVIEALASFDGEFETEKLIQRLLFIDEVEKGLKDVQEGRVHKLEDVKEKFVNKWNQ